MAITMVPGPVTHGFSNSFQSADASGTEVLVAGVTGKKIRLKFLSLTNNSAGALTFTISGAVNLVGPFEINTLSTVTMRFSLELVLADAQDLELTSDSGAISGVVQGYIS